MGERGRCICVWGAFNVSGNEKFLGPRFIGPVF